MAKNQVQFQQGLSLPGFLSQFGTEEQCGQALIRWRWPGGFVCPECGHTEHCEIRDRGLYQCNHCHRQTSLTSGTIFAHTKLALTIWFLAIYLLTQSKSGVPALELKRQLGIGYNAAWRLKHKLLQVMKERDDTKPLSGFIQLDDAYWGGERRGGFTPSMGNPQLLATGPEPTLVVGYHQTQRFGEVDLIFRLRDRRRLAGWRHC